MSIPALQAVSSLPSDVLLGTGYLFEGNTYIGVSRGGLTFTPSVEIRNVPFDNKYADIAQLDWPTGSTAVLTGSFIQFVSKIATYEPGSVSTSGSSPVTTLITPKAAGALYAAGDYLTNLRHVFPRTSGGYVQFRMASALCTQYDIKGTSKEEALISGTFAARLPLSTAASAPGTRPYVIELLSAFS